MKLGMKIDDSRHLQVLVLQVSHNFPINMLRFSHTIRRMVYFVTRAVLFVWNCVVFIFALFVDSKLLVYLILGDASNFSSSSSMSTKELRIKSSCRDLMTSLRPQFSGRATAPAAKSGSKPAAIAPNALPAGSVDVNKLYQFGNTKLYFSGTVLEVG